MIGLVLEEGLGCRNPVAAPRKFVVGIHEVCCLVCRKSGEESRGTDLVVTG